MRPSRTREDLRVVRCRVYRGRLVPRRPDHLRVAGRSARLARAHRLSRVHCPRCAGRAVAGLATGVLLRRAELIRVRAEHTAHAAFPISRLPTRRRLTLWPASSQRSASGWGAGRSLNRARAPDALGCLNWPCGQNPGESSQSLPTRLWRASRRSLGEQDSTCRPSPSWAELRRERHRAR